MTNVVVLAGRLARPAERRELPSGDSMVAYQVTVVPAEGRAESVPVVWFRAPPSAADRDVDENVVVVGRVRRRFFRSGGVTQSRTEVVADAVLPAGHKARVRTAVAGAVARVEQAVVPPGPG